MVQWSLRLALFTTSGPPEKEPKGGVPVAGPWASAGSGTNSKKRNSRFLALLGMTTWVFGAVFIGHLLERRLGPRARTARLGRRPLQRQALQRRLRGTLA